MRVDTADPLLPSGNARGIEATISGRLERLPFSRWHARLLAVVGTAHLFDSFDALTLAFVLPVLITKWSLTPQMAGLLIAAGYVGQMIGSIVFGAAAERYGRRPALRGALALLAIMSLGSAFAWSVGVLLVLRVVQGLGLGGETPVAAVYINEICPAHVRGRVVYALQAVFAVGTVLTALAALWLIPLLGWQIMFLIGALPIVLAVLLPRLMSESPRWLASKGFAAQADAVVSAVEADIVRSSGRPLPEVTLTSIPPHSEKVGFGALFRGGYFVRTTSLWLIAFCASVTGYGILSWMPSLYMTVYKLPLERALQYGFVNNLAGLVGITAAAFVIDVIGRKPVFLLGFAGAALPLLYLGLNADTVPAAHVAALSTVSVLFISLLLSGIYVYAPELYPTRMRGLGAGAAMAWLRIGSMSGPLVVGYLLGHFGIGSVFLLFGGSAIAGAGTMLLFGIETKGRVLEQIAA